MMRFGKIVVTGIAQMKRRKSRVLAKKNSRSNVKTPFPVLSLASNAMEHKRL